MDFGIAGKWALVCGASKGLGLGCAQALVREGVHVLIVARGAEVLHAAAAKLIADSARPASASVQFVSADITTVEGRAAVFSSGVLAGLRCFLGHDGARFLWLSRGALLHEHMDSISPA